MISQVLDRIHISVIEEKYSWFVYDYMSQQADKRSYVILARYLQVEP